MARLEDTGNTGLPNPPAPPRRGANPWRLSETAQMRESQPQPLNPHLRDELIEHAHVEELHAQVPRAQAEAPPPAAVKQPRSGISFLPILILAAFIAYRFFFDGRDAGGWIVKLWPLLVIAFIVHGWWRARQRRAEDKSRTG